MSLWKFVCSVLLCSSVRNRKHPLYDTTHKQHVGKFFLSRWEGFSLTERTELTEHFGAHFEPTERLRHTEFTEAFQLTLAVTLCVIGWLNVSVDFCVFCSSVFFCEKKNAPSLWENVYEIRWGVFSFTKDISFSHRTHRFNRTFLRTVSNSQNASGIQNSQNVITKDGCNVLWNRLT